MRIGLIGCGNVAEFGHLPAIKATPGLELVALCDPVAARAERFASTFGGAAFSDAEQFFDSGLDVVAVTSSAPAHHENVMAAARRGIPVLCEKPIAMADPEAEEMIAAMGATPFFVAFCYRFSSISEQVRRWVSDGVVGQVRALRLVYIWNLHGQYEQRESGDWIESPYYRGRMVEGGPLVDCGVHQIDLARWWLSAQDEAGSAIESWSAAGAWISGYDAPGHVWLHLQHAGGAASTIEVSYAYGQTAKEPRSVFTYELIGDGGVIRYDRDGYLLEARHGGGTLTAPGVSEKNFPGMYAALVARLARGIAEMPSAADGLLATHIARDATERLMRERRAWAERRRALEPGT